MEIKDVPTDQLECALERLIALKEPNIQFYRFRFPPPWTPPLNPEEPAVREFDSLEKISLDRSQIEKELLARSSVRT
jgi:hypothetical protein